jgi:aldose 1-epimerase
VPLRSIELNDWDLRLVIAPELGGAIARFDRLVNEYPVPLFRPMPGTSRDVLQAASFPVVPYANRIRNGAFRFQGREIRLPPNIKGQPLPMHGDGWLHEWRIANAGRHEVELVYEHTKGDWPWDYEARQTFTLSEDALEISLACINRSSDEMPCGLALHPYFPSTPRTMLDTEVERVWVVDADMLPVRADAPTGRYDLKRRAIGGQDLDNGYDGWSGRAKIGWPENDLWLMMISDAPRLQIYSPKGENFFAAEPVTNANAALNAPEAEWLALGLRVLKQSEAVALNVRFELLPT